MPAEALRSLLDALPLAACVHRDGRLLHANPAFLAALGIDPGRDVALTGQRVSDLVHDDDRELLDARDAELQSMMPGGASEEIRWRRPDGGLSFLRTQATRMAFDDGSATIECGMVLKTATALASFSGTTQLASVVSLAAGIAHEINNPLTYVLANLDCVRDHLRNYAVKFPTNVFDEIEEMLGEAKTGAERMARIVHSLKVFSRVEDEARAPVELHAVVEAACALASNEIRHRARLVKIYRPVPRVDANDARLTLVFYNLFLNAAQSIVEGRADDNQIQLKTWTDQGRAVVEIRDSGNGIPAEHLPRIFDPFFSTRPIGTGTGLGLAMCQGIVSSIGGEIAVETTVGVGTAFRVTLPAYGGAPTSVSEPTTRASSGMGRSGHILVVDDDPAICTAIRRTLGRRHQVITTTNGQEVIERVQRGERFDLILCDLMMPMITGMEIHAELKRVVPAQAERMVFMTGGAFTAASRAFLRDVPNQRFEKPFDSGRLRMLAKEMVDDTPPK